MVLRPQRPTRELEFQPEAPATLHCITTVLSALLNRVTHLHAHIEKTGKPSTAAPDPTTSSELDRTAARSVRNQNYCAIASRISPRGRRIVKRLEGAIK